MENDFDNLSTNFISDLERIRDSYKKELIILNNYISELDSLIVRIVNPSANCINPTIIPSIFQRSRDSVAIGSGLMSGLYTNQEDLPSKIATVKEILDSTQVVHSVKDFEKQFDSKGYLKRYKGKFTSNLSASLNQEIKKGRLKRWSIEKCYYYGLNSWGDQDKLFKKYFPKKSHP